MLPTWVDLKPTGNGKRRYGKSCQIINSLSLDWNIKPFIKFWWRISLKHNVNVFISSRRGLHVCLCGKGNAYIIVESVFTVAFVLYQLENCLTNVIIIACIRVDEKMKMLLLFYKIIKRNVCCKTIKRTIKIYCITYLAPIHSYLFCNDNRMFRTPLIIVLLILINIRIYNPHADVAISFPSQQIGTRSPRSPSLIPVGVMYDIRDRDFPCGCVNEWVYIYRVACTCSTSI